MPASDSQIRSVTLAAFHAWLAVLLVSAMFGTAIAGEAEDAAVAYEQGDYATALRLNLSLANAGNAVAQFNLGRMYDNGNGMPQDHIEAAKWFRKAADQGLAAGQFNVGVGYEKGEGLPQDYAEAARWYHKAADQDFAMAEYNLGVLYAQGRGVARDYIEAYKWFGLAASPFLAVDKTVAAKAAKSRDMVAAHMTPTQISTAQRLVSEWKPTK